LFKDAVQWLHAYKGRISKGEVGIQAIPTVKLAFEHMMAEKESRTSEAHRDRARRAIELHVLPHIGHKPADQVTKQEVEEILKHYLAGESKRIMDVGKGEEADQARGQHPAALHQDDFQSPGQASRPDQDPFRSRADEGAPAAPGLRAHRARTEVLCCHR
jgi:hypothetical protein